MSDLDTRLTAALNADTPPARDARFRVEVLVRLEQARFRRQVLRTVIVAVPLAILAVVIAPDVQAWAAADRQRLWIAALAGTAALGVLPAVLITPRFRSAIRTVGRLLYPES
jgi:hypothetical protein